MASYIAACVIQSVAGAQMGVLSSPDILSPSHAVLGGTEDRASPWCPHRGLACLHSRTPHGTEYARADKHRIDATRSARSVTLAGRSRTRRSWNGCCASANVRRLRPCGSLRFCR